MWHWHQSEQLAMHAAVEACCVTGAGLGQRNALLTLKWGSRSYRAWLRGIDQCLGRNGQVEVSKTKAELSPKEMPGSV